MSPAHRIRRDGIEWGTADFGPASTGRVIAGFSPPALAIACITAPQTSSSVVPASMASRAAAWPMSAIREAVRVKASSWGDLM